MTDQEKVRRAVEEDCYVGDVGTLGQVLVKEIKRLREDVNTACRMLAKLAWKGPWNLTPDEWAAKGRVMAGLPPEPGPGAGGAGGDDDDSRSTTGENTS